MLCNFIKNTQVGVGGRWSLSDVDQCVKLIYGLVYLALHFTLAAFGEGLSVLFIRLVHISQRQNLYHE